MIEAFCRGRPVVGARAGGIVDEIRDGENGVLVEPEDAEALADAIVACSSTALAEQLGARARASAERDGSSTPEEFAEANAGARRL